MKLTSYNFIQTPYGAEKISAVGTFTVQQRDPYETGSVKRVIYYDTDNMQTWFKTKSLDQFLSYINN